MGVTDIHPDSGPGDIEMACANQHLGLVDIVDLDRLEDLRLHVVPDARLGHHRDGHRLLDLNDHLGVRHARHAAVDADVGGDALKGHDGDGAGSLRQLRLLHVHHVHDDASLQGLGHATLYDRGTGGTVHRGSSVHCGGLKEKGGFRGQGLVEFSDGGSNSTTSHEQRSRRERKP